MVKIVKQELTKIVEILKLLHHFNNMVKLEIKKIKGKKYIYIKDKVRVNDKTLRISTYVGRFGENNFRRLLDENS